MAQLTVTAAEIETGVDNSNVFLEEVSPPLGFNTPVVLSGIKAQKVGDKFGCNLKPSDLIDVSAFTNILYVNKDRPDDSGSGTSLEFAKKTIRAAVDAAIASGLPTRIKIVTGEYGRATNFGDVPKVLTAPISFEAIYGRVLVGPFDPHNWTVNATYSNVYQITRSEAQQLFNPSLQTGRGDEARYKFVNSLALCAAEPGTFYTDNITVFVHTHSGAPANNGNVRVILNAKNLRVEANQDIYMSGIDFIGGNEGSIHIQDGSTNKIVVNDCTFKYAIFGTYSSTFNAKDGCEILGCGLFATFDSEASFNSKDGFNIHWQNPVKPASLIVNCKGYENGAFFLTSQSCNGYTVHDGCIGIDIGSEWLGSIGTNSGHVNDDTQVWSYGVTSGNSDGDYLGGGNINYGAFGVWSGNAKMWLEHCKDIGSNIGIYASVSENAKYRNHSGQGTKVNAIPFTR